MFIVLVRLKVLIDKWKLLLYFYPRFIMFSYEVIKEVIGVANNTTSINKIIYDKHHIFLYYDYMNPNKNELMISKDNIIRYENLVLELE